MKHRITPRSLVAGIIAAFLLLLGAGSMVFVAHAASARQSGDSDTTTPDSTPDAPAVQETMSFTTTDFDNQIFILAPSVRPERFVDCVDNPYYPMIPGTVYTYQTETEESMETTTVTITNQTKEVMGISTTVFHDVVSNADGQVIEDTYDWYAQDVNGNIWYFGEDVTNYDLENGTSNHDGSWQAGVDGAVPGIIMLANPVVGDVYREEYWAGEATDMAAVSDLDASASTPVGEFTGMLETANYNPLDNELEYKQYEPGLGFVAAQIVGMPEHTVLTSIVHDASIIPSDETCGGAFGVAFVGTIPVTGSPDNLQDLAQINAADAELSALGAYADATVSSMDLVVQNGFLVYSIALDSGTTVLVDAGDGVVLATATAVDDMDGAEDVDEVGDVDILDEEDETYEDADLSQEEGEVNDDADLNETSEDDVFIGSIAISRGQTNVRALAEITQDEAVEAAQTAHPDASAVEAELSVENGYLVYEVELDNGVELIVDAGTGEILLTEGVQ